MKRSEVVNRIKEYFITEVDDLTMYEVNTYSEGIMKLLESDKLMLPNTICYNAVGEYGKIEDTDILHDNDVSFSWEPEDE